MKQKAIDELVDKRKRLWKNIFRLSVVILILAVAAWGYEKLTDPKLFPIKVVQIKGDYSHIDHNLLQSIITPYLKASFFGLRSAKLRNDLQQIPWVDEVSIQRIFPATIVVNIVQKLPAFIWNKTALVASEGEVFTPDLKTYPNLPTLNGPEDEQKLVWQTVEQIDQLLQPLNLTVQELDLSPRLSWSMVLSNGIQVVIGKQNVTPVLQQFVAVYPKIVGDKSNQVVSIDLRYPNGLAVQWKP